MTANITATHTTAAHSTDSRSLRRGGSGGGIVQLTLKNSWAHKRRLVGTFLAVLLGVSFLSGTLVLGDTLRANFDQLFTQALEGTDVVVQPRPLANDGSDDAGFSAQTLDASLAGTIDQLPGVRTAAAQVIGFGQLVSKTTGERVGGNGPPTLAGNWIEDQKLNPYRIADGRAPEGADEVVVNRSALDDAGLRIGDTATILMPQPVQVTVVGSATFGDADGAATSTFVAFSDAGTAAHIQKTPGTASQILVSGDGSMSQSELRDSIEKTIDVGGADYDVKTGAQAVSQNNADISEEFLGFLTTFLVMFAGIALLVATFSIYNTFSILVAQRTRESALMRAIGASKRQILGGTLLEALLVGVAASAVGLGVGLLFATGLKAMFDAFGFGLPAGGLTFTVTSFVLAFVVGVVVTVLAALGPARRAGRVAPIEALRENAAEPARVTTRRIVTGAAVTGVGVATLLVGVLALSSYQLQVAGLGALVTLIGTILLGPVVAGPMGRFLGAPLAAIGGVPGELARDNAIRNPRRTASTAAALMVGVAVVTLFSVMITSATSYISGTVDRGFGGDFVVSSSGFGPPSLPADLPTQAEGISGVGEAVGLGNADMELAGDSANPAFSDPAALSKLVDLDVRSGSMADVTGDAIALTDKRAEELRVGIGDTVKGQFPDGTDVTLTVRAIYASPDLIGNELINEATWAGHAPIPGYDAMFVTVADGASASSVRSELESLTEPLGKPDVQDRQEFTDSVAGQLNALLGLVMVMLALAIIIALMGIANTLALSVYERTREIGLLRAVGATRRQLRRTIRWESVIISAFGTIGGIGLGVVLGWALVTVAFADATVSAFAIPVVPIVVTVLVGVVAGVLAAARPARRAAKRDVLESIAMAS